MPQPEVFAVDDHGGYFSVPHLTDLVMRETAYASAFDNPAWVESVDDSDTPTAKDIRFDRVVDLSTMIAPEITEFSEIPRADFQVSQGTLTRSWYALAVDFSEQLQRQGRIKVKAETQRLLRKAIQLTTNYYAYKELDDNVYLRYTPRGTSSSPTRTLDDGGSATTAAQRDIQAWDIRTIWDDLHNLRVEPFDGIPGIDYVCICHPSFLTALKQDSDFRQDWRDADPKRLVKGWQGDYEGIRFVLDDHMLSNALGTTSYKAEAFIFGRRPLLKSVLMEPEIRGETISGSLGLQQVLGFVGAFGYAYPYPSAEAGQCNGVFVDST